MAGFPRNTRPTIADVAKQAGVSISTVDRVLNGRAPVRSDTATRIQAAAEALGFHAAGVLRERVKGVQPKCTLGFLLQEPQSSFYRALGHALEEAVEAVTSIRGQARIVYLDDISPEAVSEKMRELGEQVDALAVVAGDHPLIAACVEQLATRQVPVYAMLTDLSTPLRAGFIGLDNRRKGRIAAWFITQLAKEPGPIAIFVGSHRIQCQELCEMSFRSYVRELAPEFEVLEPIVTMESTQVAMEGMRDILRRHPDLAGFYVVGSGVDGVLHALQAEAVGPIIGVGHEQTPATRQGLLSRKLHAALSHPIELLAKKVVEAMATTLIQGPQSLQQIIVPLAIQTPESV